MMRDYSDAKQAQEKFHNLSLISHTKCIMESKPATKGHRNFEINKAFPPVGIINTQKLKLDADHVNANGGGISSGHPLGFLGARIVVALIIDLKQNSANFRAASICNRGGGASEIVIENIDYKSQNT